jgi:hypothetical protein
LIPPEIVLRLLRCHGSDTSHKALYTHWRPRITLTLYAWRTDPRATSLEQVTRTIRRLLAIPSCVAIFMTTINHRSSSAFKLIYFSNSFIGSLAV